MHKLKAVIKREYKDVVKKKSFVIGTLITPLFMFGVIFLPILFIQQETKDPIEFTLLDGGSGLIDDFKEAFVDTLPDGRPLYLVDYINATAENIDEIQADLNSQVENDVLDFYIYIPDHIVETSYAERYSKNIGSFSSLEQINSVISNVVRKERLREYDVPPDMVQSLTSGVNLAYQQVGPEIKQKSEGQFFAQYLSGLAFVMILFGVIVGYGQHLSRAVMEEKTTRVIEVLVSSLTPFQIMMGKILGLGAASITQLVIWFAMGAGFVMFGSSSSFLGDVIQNAKTLQTSFFVTYVCFFILGYFLYISIFALIGSVVSSDKDSQQLIGPINLILLVPMILGWAIIQDPGASWVVALSIIPLFAPTMMIMRAAVSTVPAWEVLLSGIIMVVSILVVGWLTSRIFRVGILMYGKRPTIPEMIKWVRYR